MPEGKPPFWKKILLAGGARAVSHIKCKSCGWLGTMDKWKEKNGCPKCQSDLYEEGGSYEWRKT